MPFSFRDAFQGHDNVVVSKLKRFLYGSPLGQFRHHAAGGNGARTSVGFKFYIRDSIAAHFDAYLHLITAGGITDDHLAIRMFQLPHITGVGKVINDQFRIEEQRPGILDPTVPRGMSTPTRGTRAMHATSAGRP